jgi:hypothetical protein
MIPCRYCGNRIFKINISKDLLNDIERFPFAIITMHVSNDGLKQVHTLVAYIDKNLTCRHVELLSGKRFFITPYVLYNPSLLFLSCNKNLGNLNISMKDENNDG